MRCPQIVGGEVVHSPQDIPRVGRMAVIIDPQGAALAVTAYAMPTG
jgi:predicted enzyme related to lactoylglutathione lyase